MRFTAAAFLFGLVALTVATPTPPEYASRTKAKRALTSQSYAQFQVSDGVAGNALAEVQAKFPVDESNLAAVSASDLSILNAARLTAEAAEVGTGGFNDQLAASSGTAKTAFQNGKTKNKVLKLKFEVLVLQIKQAQGSNQAAKIAAEQTKLNNNIALDTKAAGQASVGVSGTFKG